MCAVLRPRQRHDVSVAEYQRMIASGELPEDARVELIDGEIVDKEVRTPEHENAVRWLIRWLRATLSMEYDFTVSGPIERDRSQPEPDLMIVPHSAPVPSHPRKALLAIEVTRSSHTRDLDEKPAIYAPAVDEYWVIDLRDQVVVVHRSPENGAYRNVTEHPRGEQLTPSAIGLAPVDSDALFAAAFAENA